MKRNTDSRLSLRFQTLLALGAALASSSAYAWDTHRNLMPETLKALGDSLPALHSPIPAPCLDEDQAMYKKLAQELMLNPDAKVLPTHAIACARGATTTGAEILSSFVVDEPDMGMDKDLPWPPEKYDPNGYQKWMGGSRGPTSQGFRHMYFGGVQLWHPIRTFQIPVGAVGYAPERAELMALKARELFKQGKSAWGFRVLGWAAHYLQDLSQPFHSTQIPDMKMVPWYSLLKWPPQEGFAALVKETTRTISNYHWAYEAYTNQRLTDEQSRSDHSLSECLGRPDQFSTMKDDARIDEARKDPKVLAQRVAKNSVGIAHDVGRANMDFFGSNLKLSGVDLPANKGTPDYKDYAIRPDLSEPREELRKVTCKALSNSAWAVRALIQWALQP